MTNLKEIILKEMQENGKNNQVEIDFSGLCTVEELQEAVSSLGLQMEESDGEGVWWIYRSENIDDIFDELFRKKREEGKEIHIYLELFTEKECYYIGQEWGKCMEAQDTTTDFKNEKISISKLFHTKLKIEDKKITNLIEGRKNWC